MVHCHLHYDDIGRNSEELGEDIIEDEQGEPHRGLLTGKSDLDYFGGKLK